MRTIKTVSMVIGIIIPNVFYAQSKWHIGPSYQSGISSYWGKSDMSMDNTMSTPDFSIKFSSGTGVQLHHAFKTKWSWNALFLYQQRGAKFDEVNCDCPPKYKINYGDVRLGLNYIPTTNEKVNFFISAGATTSFRFSAYRENGYEALNIEDDIKKLDFGTFTSFGLNFKLWDKDILQTSLFFNSGFTNVFSGMLEMNGVYGKNILAGIQINYLIGLGKTKE